MDIDQQADDGEHFHVLVTGANSGLGFDICRRLIDEFLFTRPSSHNLILTVTTRTHNKGNDTLRRLHRHLQSSLKQHYSSAPIPDSTAQESRVQLQYELVDLTALVSVQSLISRLLDSTPKLDAIVLNAGIGGWTGLYWPGLAYQITTDFITALTWPSFKISDVGTVAKPQLPDASGRADKEPPLGEVFCANTFGHYMLVHGLMPLLSRSSAGRIIWISTLEAHASTLRLDDFQNISAPLAYESSKRLTDVISLTSTLPATAPWTKDYFQPQGMANGSSSNETAVPNRPKMYVCHPGICATSIMPLNAFLQIVMRIAMYMARWFGSIWHTCDSYTGACSAVWLALMSQELLDSMEYNDGPGKWGSATDRAGHERVERTEVEGWGFGGIEGDVDRGGGHRKGRRRGAMALTKEAREEFEQLGRHCWTEMERLRVEWTDRLNKAGKLPSAQWS